jgi:hypothetical protein
MRSGVPNFCAVALALNDMGYASALLYTSLIAQLASVTWEAVAD